MTDTANTRPGLALAIQSVTRRRDEAFEASFSSDLDAARAAKVALATCDAILAELAALIQGRADD